MKRSQIEDNVEANWEAEHLHEVTIEPNLISRLDKKRKGWLVATSVVLFVAVAGFLYIRAQIKEREAAVVEDVLAIHHLLLQGVFADDDELFRLLINKDDPAWAENQLDLFRQNLLLDRQALELTLADAEPKDIDVDLGPNLSEAQVTSRWGYYDAADHNQEMALEYTVVYRLNADGWQLSRPASSFWGESRTIHGRLLTLTYPERDAEIATQLVPDLDSLLAEMCQTLKGINCPDDDFLSVHLDDDPNHLRQLADTRIAMQQGRAIDVPAPTLLGMPVDDAAYQALYRWYATQIVSAAITDLTGYACCARFPFYQALLNRQLSQLGLRSWGLDDAYYQRLIQEPEPIQRLSRYWTWSIPIPPSLSEDKQLLRAFVDYLSQGTSEQSLAEYQKWLGRSPAFTAWIQVGTDEARSLEDIEGTWRQFAYRQLDLTPPPASVSLPDQNVYLACITNITQSLEGQELVIVGYDPQSDRWLPETLLPVEETGRRSLLAGELVQQSATAVPNSYQRLLLHRQTPIENGTRTKLFDWRGESITPILDSGMLPAAYRSYTFTDHTDPAGEQLVLAQGHESREARYALASVGDCRAGNCDLQSIPGWPIWSPDSRHAIFVSDIWRASNHEQVPLLLGGPSGDQAEPVAEGYLPFWLNNENYGYVQRQPVPAIWTANVANDQPRLLVELDTFEPILTPEYPVERWTVRQIIFHPTDPDWFFLLLATPKLHVVSYHRDTGAAELHVLTEPQGAEASYTFHISPDGRWLTILWGATVDDPQPHWIELLDLEKRIPTRTIREGIHQSPVTSHNWSSDGRWLILHGNQTISIYTPLTEETISQAIEKSYAHSCFFTFWSQ